MTSGSRLIDSRRVELGESRTDLARQFVVVELDRHVDAAVQRGVVSAPVLVASHNDADGLAAAAILARSFVRGGWSVRTEILGRGQSPWTAAFRDTVRSVGPGGLIVADLGTRAGLLAPGVPTIVLDHHVPAGTPEGAVLISGYGADPIPTTSLLAYRCARALTDAGPLLWLAAVGLIGDMAEDAGFPEMEEARRTYGITALRTATSLLNAPRRSASGDTGPALALLMSAHGPKEITSGERPETAALLAAREEVKAAVEAGKRIAPRLRNGVALVRFDTPCQVHPLLAQTWRGRLKGEIVLAANAAYRPGWVHFAVRSGRKIDLVAFLAEHAPPGVDENYGSGHAAATGGALRPAAWNAFVTGLGFGPEEQVAP